MHLRNAAILFCLFCCVSLNAQILPFHSYTTRDGLLSNTITALYQDSRGFLWIGTNNGLSMYDGASFKNYTAANGLSNNWVTVFSAVRARLREMFSCRRVPSVPPRGPDKLAAGNSAVKCDKFSRCREVLHRARCVHSGSHTIEVLWNCFLRQFVLPSSGYRK